MKTGARPITLLLVWIAAFAAVSASAQEKSIEEARAAMARGDRDAAIAVLEKAVANYPQSARASHFLGDAYLAKGETMGMMGAAPYAMKANAAYEKAIALDPKFVEPRYAMVRFYAAAPAFAGGSMEKAFEQAKVVRTLDPIWGHRAFAFVYSRQNKPELATQEYLDAIREHPESPKAHGYFGAYLANTEKRYGAALREFEAAVRVDPSYMPGCYHIGRVAALGDTSLARGEAMLKKYLAYTPKENEPTLASAQYYLGVVYEKQGRKAEAKQSYESALKLNPTLKDASEALKAMK